MIHSIPYDKIYRNFIRSIIVFPQSLTVIKVQYIHIREGFIVQESNLEDIIEVTGSIHRLYYSHSSPMSLPTLKRRINLILLSVNY